MDTRRKKHKVFGIGFHKTATTSLANALYILGYNVTGFFGVKDPEISNHVYEQAYSLADRYDAAQDTPWPILYKELDQRYPESKFILTIRDEDRWIKSIVKHFKRKYIPAHEWIYGVKTAKGNEQQYLHRYREHNQEVIEYFKDRPGDLLVIDITKGAGWEKICPFLGLEIPPVEFPKENTAKEKSDQFLIRAVKFMKRTFLFRSKTRSGNTLDTGVSTAFVRDTLHYHYAMYENVWEGILHQISEAQFHQNSDCNQYSLYELLRIQIEEELFWLNRLNGSTEVSKKNLISSGYNTKETLYQLWQQTRLRMRQNAANLTEEMCNSKVAGSSLTVWEVFFHLVDFGTGHHAQIVELLQGFGVEIETQNFLRFFGRTAEHVQ